MEPQMEHTVWSVCFEAKFSFIPQHSRPHLAATDKQTFWPSRNVTDESQIVEAINVLRSQTANQITTEEFSTICQGLNPYSLPSFTCLICNVPEYKLLLKS